MNKATIITPIRRASLVVLFLLTAFFSACSSDNDSAAPVNPDPDGGEVINPENPDDLFYEVIRVENFKGSTSDENPTGAQATLFYSLEDNKPVDESYKKTRKWDLAFGSLYASFLSGNNGANTLNNGSGAGGLGGIAIVEQPFDEVVDVPADSAFKTGKDLIGTDDAGDFGAGIGWYLYDFGGEIVRDSAYDNQHVAYALGAGLTLQSGTVLSPRTVILKTANGNIAKIKMVSVYKDIFSPELWFRTTPHMYYTFEYVMVPKGSLKFEIK